MFFLRCAFFLSIVYWSMSWPPATQSAPSLGASLAETGRAQAEELVRTAAAKATDLCARHASECLADAARLTSLFATADRVEEDSATEAGMPADVPLPVPDPRRHGRGAKLAVIP